MNVQHYKDTIYITGQVLPEDITALIKDYGFSVIVNNRIDGEEVGQPESKTFEAVCKDAAVEYYYLPMRHRGDIPHEYLKARDELLRTHQNEKILFFCRTGGRSEALLNQA